MISLSQKLKKLLNVKFTLPDGNLAAIFVRSKRAGAFANVYDCVICSICNLPPSNVISHASGNRHKQNLDVLDLDYQPDDAEEANIKRSDEGGVKESLFCHFCFSNEIVRFFQQPEILSPINQTSRSIQSQSGTVPRNVQCLRRRKVKFFPFFLESAKRNLIFFAPNSRG